MYSTVQYMHYKLCPKKKVCLTKNHLNSLVMIFKQEKNFCTWSSPRSWRWPTPWGCFSLSMGETKWFFFFTKHHIMTIQVIFVSKVFGLTQHVPYCTVQYCNVLYSTTCTSVLYPKILVWIRLTSQLWNFENPSTGSLVIAIWSFGPKFDPKCNAVLVPIYMYRN